MNVFDQGLTVYLFLALSIMIFASCKNKPSEPEYQLSELYDMFERGKLNESDDNYIDPESLLQNLIEFKEQISIPEDSLSSFYLRLLYDFKKKQHNTNLELVGGLFLNEDFSELNLRHKSQVLRIMAETKHYQFKYKQGITYIKESINIERTLAPRSLDSLLYSIKINSIFI